MATINSSLSSYDGSFRLLGLNNSFFNTNDLVEAELQMLQLQISPQQTQKQMLTEEKQAWQSFKTDFSALAKVFSDAWLYNANQKSSVYSKEGVVSFEANASSVEADYKIKVNYLAEKHQLSGKDMGATDVALKLDDTIKINGKELAITGDMTLRDVVNKINTGDFGTSASIISNRLVLTSKSSGFNNAITLEDGANGALKGLGVLSADGSIANQLKAARDASYSINGIELTSASNEISDAIDGVKITLNNVSTDGVDVSVRNNKDAVIKQIEDMVNAYNKAMMQFNKYTEKGTYLQGQSLPLTMRRELSNMTSFKNSAGNYLYEFGVETNKESKDGTLKFDKTKLTEQYEKDPKKVIDMFFGDGGLAKEMKDRVEVFTKETGSVSEKINGIDKTLKTIETALERFNVTYEQKKESILKKYADFETRLSTLNSQMAYIEAQMKSLSGSKDN